MLASGGSGSCTMENSNSDSDLIGSSYVRITKLCCEQGGAYPRKYSQVKTNLELDICKIWCSKPLHVLRDYCDVIKIYIFWPLLFQREQTPVVSQLHPCIDISSGTCELSLKRLQHIELLEDIVDLAKKVVDDQFFIGGILRIGYKIENKILAIEEAFNWVKYTGEFRILRKLERAENCWPMLSIFFTEYKYHITKVVLEDCNLVEEFEYQNCAACIKEGEIMKTRGNEEFSEERFDTAITYYTRAIEFRPENHLLYSNRALCFLRTGQFKCALGDGKRATILKYNWPKGHYRFCDALSMLGEHAWALEANERAQHLCRNYPDGMKDLTQQNIKLLKQVEELRGSKHGMRKSIYGKRLSSGSPKPSHSGYLNLMETNEENKVLKLASKYRDYYQYQNLKVSREILKLENKSYQPELPPAHTPKCRGKSRIKNEEMGKPSLQLNLQIDLQSLLDKQFSKSSRAVQQDFAILIKMLQSLIEEGCTALMDQHCRSAAKAFSRLLSDLDPNKLKQLNLALINYVLVIYGYAISLLGIGLPEELSEAEYQFKRIIDQYPNEGVDCLAYFGIGKVYLKKNRFSDALGHFEKSKTMIKLIPGVLTWPTTNVIIEESQAEKLQLILENHIEECKFPPNPDAVCCYQKCNGYSKIQIYLSDPDFKGFIRINCCQFCRIEFHISCWKKLKTTIFNDKNDKEFLQETCLTPDCRGIISKIVIFGATGHIKCEFEHRVTKERDPPRPVMKQKCSSLEKLKIKEEKKVKRKLQRKEAKKLAKERLEEKTVENNSSKQGDHKGFVQSCQFPDDRVLQCIKQNSEQIKSGIQDTSKLLRDLLCWKVISTEDYADSYFNSGLLRETVEHLLEHLIRKNNRVNTRIFLHVLSEINEVKPKLRDWINKLNSLGLDATRMFFSRYGDCIKELDFKLIAVLWDEKYGRKLDHVITIREERDVAGYFNNPGSLKEARSIIWLLEENREKFPALHNALDEFFDIMDGPCTILRKQENEDISTNGIKVKNKTRKKKHKESKPVFILSGVGGVTQNDDKTGTDESSLLPSNSYDPFVVPDYLRDEVEEFEALYEKNSSNNSHYKKLDSNLDPKCEPLYDYFSQILEEHGPLEIDDKLLVGEYELFPEETRKIVEEAGGLKSFLLDSLRFVMIDNYIGLMKDAVQLKKKKTTGAGEKESTNLDEKDSMFSPSFQKNTSQFKPQLNPAAKEFKPVSCNSHTPASKSKKGNRAAKHATAGHTPHNALNTGLSNQGFDTSNTPASHANVLPQSSQCVNICTPASDISSDYKTKRKIPPVSAAPPATDTDRRDNHSQANCEAHHVNTEKPMGNTLEKVCSSGKLTYEKQIHQNTQKTTVKSDVYKNNTAKDTDSRNNEHCNFGMSKLEAEMKNTTIIKNTPCTRMVAIQVKKDLMHQEVNTVPFGPFETQQGDILRMEKEHQVLQEQLKEAREKYEQLKCRSTEETRELEEKLKRTMEENKITKTELNWFHQDLEIEMKKWQQEKKENQEKLKALRNKVKKLTDSNEIYSRNNEEKDQQYASHLDQFLKISNKFANEKLKMEELIKKGKENYHEAIKRAVAAEVTILENWKNTDVNKLQTTLSKAEMYIKNLKLMNSGSISYLNLESEINHWESFISKIKKEIEKAEFEFEDRIQKVKAGSQLDKLSKVKVPEFPLPTNSLLIQGKLAHINDPSSNTYSTQVHPKSLPEFSSPDDQSPVIVPTNLLTGNQTLALQNTSVQSVGDCSMEIPSALLEASYTDPCQLMDSEKETQINQSPTDVAQTHASTLNQPQKTFNNVIEHLAAIFPNYSSAELLNFIQEVQSQDRSTHAGLESDEIVRSVTELILDEQNKKTAVQGKDMVSVTSGAIAATESSGLRHSAENVSISSPSKVPGPQTVASKPWVVVGGPSKSKWQKSNDSPASGDDPCIICYEELNQEGVCEMECGHQFHKWAAATHHSIPLLINTEDLTCSISDLGQFALP